MPKETTKKESKASKKSAPKGGIKVGSAARAMKVELGKSRLSTGAVERAILEVEDKLRHIAKQCKAALQIAGKKTLKHEILLAVLDQQCAGKHVLIAARSGNTEKKRKGDRNIIATASVLRVIKKELGDFRISASAADALSHIAEACLQKIASGAVRIAENDKRSTVKTRDVETYVEVNNC